MAFCRSLFLPSEGEPSGKRRSTAVDVDAESKVLMRLERVGMIAGDPDVTAILGVN